MTSEARRDPLADALLTPENAALILIDYQPPQLNTIRSMSSLILLRNAVSLAQTAKTYGLPAVISTVGVQSGLNPDTVPELKQAMADAPWIDRTSINAWEDADFVAAVKATGRRKLVIGALWTEVCLAFPVTGRPSCGLRGLRSRRRRRRHVNGGARGRPAALRTGGGGAGFVDRRPLRVAARLGPRREHGRNGRDWRGQRGALVDRDRAQAVRRRPRRADVCAQRAQSTPAAGVRHPRMSSRNRNTIPGKTSQASPILPFIR